MEQEIIDILKKIPIKYETCNHKEEVWITIKEHIRQRQNTRQTSRIKLKVWPIAACIALLLSIILLIETKVNVKSGDTSLTIFLPDSSRVKLFENSILRYNLVEWWFTRHVHLSGTACFDVSKGEKFKVITAAGNISVLGTKFLVAQDSNHLLVECYKGSVRLQTKAGEKILYPGEKTESDDSTIRSSKIDDVPAEYTIYQDVSLKEIFPILENIFGLVIINKEEYENYIFSGMMSTLNKNEALDVIFGSCGIKYSLRGKELVLEYN